MKNLVKSALLVAAISLSTNVLAAPKTDANYLAECKRTVKAQFDSVNKIEVAGMSSRRNLFKAKLRVVANGERSMVACEIRGDEPVALNCVKGNTCESGTVASN